MPECTILIADDEALARAAIKIALPANRQLRILEAENGDEALAMIKDELPDIIFLDVQMPGLTGFEVLSALPRSYHPAMVMVTAHEEFALKAYEHNAIDYLLKPFTDQRFAKAFDKAYSHWQQKDLQNQVDTVRSLAEQLQMLLGAGGRKNVTVKDGAKIFVIPVDEILFIEAKDDYTAINTTTKKHLHNETLAQLEQTLPPVQFARIHRSTIVNTAYIKELQSHYNGDYTVVLKNEQTLKLSRNYREQLMKILG